MKYDAHIKRNPSDAVDFAKAKPDESSKAALFTFLGKAFLKQLGMRRELTDEEWLEMVRKEGGKELQKYIREVGVPMLDKIDPDLKDVVKRIKKALSKANERHE